MASGGWDKTIRIWSLSTGECMKILQNDSSVECLQLRKSQLLTGSQSGRISVWDVESGKMVRSIPAHTGVICKLKFEGKRIVSSGYDKTLRIFEFSNDVPSN